MEVEIDLKNLKPNIRRLSDMKGVVFDVGWLKTVPEGTDIDLYYMYRKIKNENGLSYNITVTPARMLGKEFIKTKGHTHIGIFAEIYTVLEGEAIFLMQNFDNNTVEDVYAVMAKKGESAIVPPGYGHITINPGKTDLKTGDWSAENCKSDYSLFEKMQGACYYYTKDGPASANGFGEAGWIKNKNYKNAPDMRFEKPIKSLPKDLSFLKG